MGKMKKSQSVVALSMMLGQVVLPTVASANEVLNGETPPDNIAEAVLGEQEEPETNPEELQEEPEEQLEPLRDSDGNVTLTDSDVNVEGGIIESLTQSGELKMSERVNKLLFDLANSTVGLGDSLFRGNAISEVVLNDTISVVGDKAFEGSGVSKITFGNNPVSVGAYSFADNEITNIDLSNVTSIGDYAFQDNKLEELNTKGVQVISAGAFSNNNIGSLIIEEGTVELGESAFSGNIIKEVALADSVTTLGEGVFNDNGQVVKVLSNTITGAELSEEHFGYVINPREVTVRYVDETTNEDIIPSEILGADLSDVNNIFGDGETVTLHAKVVKGYKAKQEAITKLIGKTNEVVFSYEKDNSMLEISIPDKNVIAGATVSNEDLLFGVEILDSKGNDVTGNYKGNVTFSPNSIDTSVPGAVTVIATVDKNGKSGSTTFEVIVGKDYCETPLGNGWTVCDFEYTGTQIDGFSKKGKEKLKKGNTDLVLPGINRAGEPITSIKGNNKYTDAGVFKEKGLTSVDLSGCTNLQEIGDYAFDENNLTSLNLSSCTNLQEIGAYAFYENNLTSLDLSGCTNLKEIGTTAFSSNDLTSLNLSSCTNLQEIGVYAFYENNLTSLDLSGCTNLQTIGRRAFRENKLTSLDLSGCTQLQTIEDYAFYGNKLTTLDLSGCNKLQEIGERAFYANKLTSLDLSGCTNLQTIGRSAYSSNKLTSLDLSGCTKLQKIGEAAFFNNNLTSVDLSGCTNLQTIGSGAFQSNNLTSVDLSGCTNLQEIVKYAFQNNKLTSLDLSSCAKLQTIGDYAFYGNNLTSVDLSGCTNLTSLSGFSSNKLSSLDLSGCNNLQKIGGSAFRDNNLTSVDFSGCTKLQEIGFRAFNNNKLPSLDLSGCTNLQTIGEVAFNDNKLTSLDISGCTNLQAIEYGAFWRNKLTSLDFSNCTNLKEVGGHAFYENNLTSLDLSGCTNLQKIGFGAFWRNKLTSLDLSGCTNLKEIGGSAFYENNLTSLDLSGCTNLKEIGADAFTNTTITITNSVTSLGNLSGSTVYTEHRNNPNDLSCDSSCLVDPTKLTVQYTDKETGDIISTTTREVSYTTRVTTPAKYIPGYLPIEETTHTVVPNVDGILVTIPVTKFNPDNIQSILGETGRVSLTHKVRGLDKVEIGQKMSTDVSLDLSGFDRNAGEATVRVYYNTDLVDSSKIKTQNGTTFACSKKDGYVEIKIKNFIGGADIKTPIQWAYKENVTPNTVNEPFSAVAYIGGSQVTYPQVVNLKGYYEQPSLHKEATIGEGQSYYTYSSEDTVQMTYNFDITNLERNIAEYTITDELPTYEKEDGTRALAIFKPELNKGWVLNENGTTLTYSGNANGSHSGVLGVKLTLEYPNAKLHKIVTNKASAVLTPHLAGEGEPNLIVADSTYNYIKGFRPVTPVHPGGGVAPEYISVDKDDNALRGRYDNTYIFDTLEDRQEDVNWELYVYNGKKEAIQNMKLTDTGLDERLYYKGYTIRGNNSTFSVNVLDKDGDLIYSETATSGETKKIREKYAREVGSIEFIKDGTTDFKTREHITVITHLRDESLDILPNWTPEIFWTMDNRLDYEFNYDDGTTKGSIIDHVKVYRLLRDMIKPTKTMEIVGNDEDDITVFGNGTIKFELGADCVHNGAIDVGEFMHKVKDFEYIDLIPNELAFQNFTLNSKWASQLEWELIPNFNNSGKVGLRIYGKLVDAVGLDSIDLGTLTTNVSTDMKVERFENFGYLNTDEKNTEVIGKRNYPEINGDYSRVNVSGRVDRAEEMFARKYIKPETHGVWSTDGYELLGNEEFRYKLQLSNLTEHDRKDIDLVDILPHVGDRAIINNADGERISRGSEFTPVFNTSKPVIVPEGYSVQYYNGTTEDWEYAPGEEETFLRSLAWEDTATPNTKAVRITSNEGVLLNNSSVVNFEIPMRMPNDTTLENMGKIAYNTYVRSDDRTTHRYLEPNRVWVKEKAIRGKISLRKTGLDKYSLPGAVFQLLDLNRNVIQTKTTNNQGRLTFDKVELKDYIIHEVHAPNGYLVDSEDIVVTESDLLGSKGTDTKNGWVTFNYNAGTVTNTFDKSGYELYGDLILNKVDTDGNGLSGVTFEIKGTSSSTSRRVTDPLTGRSTYVTIPSNKTVKRTVTTTQDGGLSVKGLLEGNYTITEISSVNSLMTGGWSKNIRITGKETTAVDCGTVINDKAKVKIYKVGLLPDKMTDDVFNLTGMDGEEIAGVTFSITDKDGVAKEYTTGSQGYFETDMLNVNEVYTLKEINTPLPYELNTLEVQFQLDSKGRLKGANGEDFVLHDTMYYPNKKVKQESTVNILKQDEFGAALTGAEFTLFKKNTETNSYEKVETKVTETNGQLSFTGILGGVYKVEETKAPTGYHNTGWKTEFVAEMYKSKTFSYSVVNPKLDLQVRKVEYLAKSVTITEARKVMKEKGGHIEESQLKKGRYNVVQTLADATFDLVNETTGEKLAEITSDEDGIAKYEGAKLNDMDTFYIKETSAPSGYAISEEAKSFKVSHFSNLEGFDGTIEFNFENKKLSGSVGISKYDGSTGETLGGAVFTVTNTKTGEQVSQTTDSNGNAYFDNLVLGEYTVAETQAPDGYTNDNWSKTFTVTETALKFNYVIYNNPSKYNYEFIKIDGKTKEGLAGVQFELYDKTTGKLLERNITSNTDGVVKLTDLDPGVTYLVKETKPLEGYNLSHEELTITYNSEYSNLNYWSTANKYEFKNYKRNEEPMPATGTLGITTSIAVAGLSLLGATKVTKRKRNQLK